MPVGEHMRGERECRAVGKRIPVAGADPAGYRAGTGFVWIDEAEEQTDRQQAIHGVFLLSSVKTQLTDILKTEAG